MIITDHDQADLSMPDFSGEEANQKTTLTLVNGPLMFVAPYIVLTS
jgi:hypothetical protein